MKRITLIVLWLSVACFSHAQGIRFEKGLTWEQVQAKAKSEKKYIFVDCYATWCGPCKQMETDVFPQKAVGELFNEKFVSVRLQMDRTAHDGNEVKTWYPIATSFEKKYGLTAYPGYLFFSPEGRPLHLFFGSCYASRFLERTSDVFDPHKQYFTLLEDWKAGQVPPDQLLKVYSIIKNGGNIKAADAIVNAYFLSVKDPFEITNLKVFATNMHSTTDPFFKFFMANQNVIDKVMKIPGAAERQVIKTIYSNEIKGSAIVQDLKAKLTAQYPGCKTFRSADSAFYYTLFTVAIEQRDQPNLMTLGNLYWKSVHNPLTKNVLKVVFAITTSVSDATFTFIQQHVQAVNAALGPGEAERKLGSTIYRSQVAPIFQQQDFHADYLQLLQKLHLTCPEIGKRFDTEFKERFELDVENAVRRQTWGRDADSINWAGVEQGISESVLHYDVHRAILQIQSDYYAYHKDWNKAETIAGELLKQYGTEMQPFYVNELVWNTIFLHGQDKSIALLALPLLRKNLEGPDPTYEEADTYANLLYKAGKKEEAVIWENKAIGFVSKQGYDEMGVNQRVKQLQATIDKMNRGEKTWED